MWWQGGSNSNQPPWRPSADGLHRRSHIGMNQQDRETISHVSITRWRLDSEPAIVRWRGRSLKAERHLPRWKQRFDSFRPLHYEPPASTIRGRPFFRDKRHTYRRKVAARATWPSPLSNGASIAIPEVKDGSSAQRPVLAPIQYFARLTGKPFPANCLQVAGSILVSRRDWPLLPACPPRPRASDIHRPSASVKYS